VPPSRSGRSPFRSPPPQRHGLAGWGEAPLVLLQEDAADPSAQTPQHHTRPSGLGPIGEGTAYAADALANHRDVNPATAPTPAKLRDT
jgi:hypothetical protein